MKMYITINYNVIHKISRETNWHYDILFNRTNSLKKKY